MSRDGIHKAVRALSQPVTYLGIGMLVVIYCALAYLLVADKNEASTSGERRAANIARIFDQSFSSIFQRVDASLLFLRKSYQQNSANFDLSAWVHDPAIKNELTIDFAILDAHGRVVDSSYSKDIIGIDRSDREFFRVHVGSATDELFVDKPMIMRSSGRWAIVMSRRMTAPDGAFAGAVVALLNPSQLGQQISKVDLGPDGAVVLLGLDGVLRARAINGEIDWKSTGRQLPSGAGVLGRVKQAKSGSYWNSSSIVDNVSRLVSYRLLDSIPLIALVGISEAEIFRHARENARIYLGVALLLSAAITVAIGCGVRRERKLIETTAEMKTAQDALRRSQERYRLVEDAVNDGIWDWNILTGETYRSPRWWAMLGYADGEVPNDISSFFDLLHPDDKAAHSAAMRAHLKEGKPFAVDIRLRCKNGEYRWVQRRGKVLHDAAKRPVRMIGTTTNICGRKRAEALIAESRDNLARAETMALLGHYKYEIGAPLHIWSDGVYQIFGKTPGSFVPTPDAVLAMVHPDDRSILEQHRRDLKSGVERAAITVRASRDDGQIVYIECWSAPIRGSDGAVTGAFGTLQNITARKQAEAALERANQQLEKRVDERTAALAQEMHRREQAQMTLGQMQKMEAVGQLTAGIAHDFNNLLAVIRGGLEFVEGAATRGLTAEPELIEAALRATRRGSELVQRLLAFSRQSPLKSEPTAINQLVLDTLRLLQRTLGEGVDIVTNLNATAAMVCVDRSQFSNALVNLALNARDAMPDGGELCIATRCQPASWAATEGTKRWPTGEEVCITVSDTGIGMTEEVRRRAMEPFFTTKRDGLGSGLGLSMVHGFVEQSGGRIEIDSAPNGGTTITIRLPRIDAVNQAVDTGLPADAPAAGRETTVLLVEDDPDVRTVTAAQLKYLGYKVHAVANGMEAIDVIESPATIDVTLTDIVLPGGIDGVSLVKEAMHARPTMAVLCMSGYASTPKHRKWLAVQNIGLLEKPFSSGQLAQALDGALAR